MSTKLITSYSWKHKSENKAATVCNTNEHNANNILEIALRDLREDKKTREQCLKQLREWIRQNKDIEGCITDSNFLLRFLRAKKFSMPMAQQMLLKYLNLRKRFKHIFYNMDYLDSRVLEIINSGYIFVSPFKDSNGRRVVIAIVKKFDHSKFNSTDMARAHLITYETLMDDEENQVLGLTHFGDVGDLSASLVTMWSITEFITLIRWGEQSFPMRHKQIHILHLHPAFRYVYDSIASLGSQKMRDRAKLYNSPEELHKTVDPCVLPEEYGGAMPMTEMVELWKKELVEKRDRLLSFDQMNLLSDRGITRRRSKVQNNGEIENMSGSFRKLEVD